LSQIRSLETYLTPQCAKSLTLEISAVNELNMSELNTRPEASLHTMKMKPRSHQPPSLLSNTEFPWRTWNISSLDITDRIR